MYIKSKLAKSVRLALAFGAVSTTAISGNAIAQEAEAQEEAVEKIAVTGSRIRKSDFVSNAPVATIGEEQFKLTATVNTEQLLNTLPQVIPGFDRTSNNPGNGTATVDLRGLGSNRTLVLIDGQRVTPTSSNGSVDINTIPTALIQDVEVLTGGASAVYGSDAVAGVINFMLKDDFEGVQANYLFETTEEGDGTIQQIDLTLGGNFAEGRGNAVVNLTVNDREEVFQGDRGFSSVAQFDGANGLVPGGSSGIPQGRIDAAFPGFVAPGILFNQDGTIRQRVVPDDNYNYAPVNYLQVPQTRHQITALGHYDINDNVTVYTRALFTDSEVPTQLAPTPIFQFDTFTLDGNPFIDPAAQQIISDGIGDGIDTDGDGIDDTATGSWARRSEEFGMRRSQDGFTSFNFMLGLKGVIGDSNWTYDVYYSTGQVENTTVQLGNINRDRYSQSLLLATDDNGQVILDANGNPSCADPAANGSKAPACVPANIYGEGNVTQAAVQFIQTDVASTAIFDQDIFEASVSGDTEGWLELPGGPIGLAFGVQHIENYFEFLPSQDLAAGTIAGFNGSPPVEGSFNVTEYYVEAYLPILEGVPMAELLDLELAWRTSDYTTIGTTDAYKIAGSWAPVEEVRVRAGFNRAVRAPNIQELFAPRSEGFPTATDPCSQENGAAADPGIAAICAATGVPQQNINTGFINSAAGQIRTLSGGNPNLTEETADTLTVGLVVTPTDDLSISLDYFDIEIEDAVASFGGGTANVLNTCYSTDPEVNPDGANSQFCSLINRFSNGAIDFVEIAQQNVATVTLKGFDLIGSYSMDFMDGELAFDYLGTYTTESDTVPFAGGDVIECAGTFGAICGEPQPEYKHRATVRYATDDYTVQLLWRFVGEVDDDDDTSTYTVETIDAENYFDLNASYTISDNYSVSGGIRNLFDTEPPIMGFFNSEQANTWPGTYDVFGRTYFVNLQATF